jgi:hypothetical protein
MTARDEPDGERPDRRACERVVLLGGLPGSVLLPQPVMVTELGADGAQLETACPFQVESLHEVRIELGSRSIVVKGRVTHCGVVDIDQEGLRYRSGMQFVDVPGHARAAIAAFLEALKAGRHGAVS